jgi:hypothetical protein
MSISNDIQIASTCKIPIKAPSIDEHLYVCRRGFRALNVQGVCDANSLFTNIVAHYAGSTRDQLAKYRSAIIACIETGRACTRRVGLASSASSS